MSAPLFESKIDSLHLLGRGKVRDIYEIDQAHLLMVTTDRLSAFDVIFPDAIPDKGKILTALTNFWFAEFAQTLPNQLTHIPPEEVVLADERIQVCQRAHVVKRLTPLPIEAVVRGYLAGSGWKEYQTHGTVCDITLPSQLQQGSPLPSPIFTPATKAAVGDHDENIAFTQAQTLCTAQLTALGLPPRDIAAEVRDTAIALYQSAANYASTKGIIIADTKFEFGVDANGTLHLIDEVLTPDSSRFWPADNYQVGMSPPSFDKQIVRDYLESIDWDKTPPAPALPATVIAHTAQKYREAAEKLGADLSQL